MSAAQPWPNVKLSPAITLAAGTDRRRDLEFGFLARLLPQKSEAIGSTLLLVV